MRGLLPALLILLGCAGSGHSPLYLHNRGDYEALRARFPKLLEPNYLPFMAARVAVPVDDAAFALPRSTVHAADLTFSAQHTRTGYGGGGEVRGVPAKLARLTLGETCRSNLQGMVLDAFPIELQFGFRIGGLLAQDFFTDCALTLDFGTMHLSLQCDEG